MVQSSHIVVAVSINTFYCDQALYHGSVIEHQLLLMIYVQGKIISRKSCIPEKFLP